MHHSQLTQLRDALFRLRGQAITPEVAQAIEFAATFQPDESIDPKLFPVEVHGDFLLQAERFSAIVDELHPLHVLHWQETEGHRHGHVLNPQYPALLSDERAGSMLQFTARENGADLVAHVRMYLATSRHTGLLTATEDTLFLRPDRRPNAFLMLALMRYVERSLRALGVMQISANSKLVNGADVLMRRLGYRQVALQFVKVFDV